MRSLLLKLLKQTDYPNWLLGKQNNWKSYVCPSRRLR